MSEYDATAFDDAEEYDAAANEAVVAGSRWLRVGAALATVALVAGCGTGSGSAEAPPSQPSTTYELPPQPCIGEPAAIPDDPKADLCARRRHGTVAFLAVDGLEPSASTGLMPRASDTAPAVARETTDSLRNLTRGGIDLRPTTLNAPSEVAAAVRAANSGFTTGQECVALDPPQASIVETAERSMPELAQYDFVVALGGTGCRGGGAEAGTVGGVALYDGETTRRSADVYLNSASSGFVQIGNQTPVDRLADTAAHEILHNFGLGHAAATYCETSPTHDDPSRPVDLARYFGADCRFDEYGAFGNVMSNVSDIRDPAEDYNTLLAVQRSFLDVDDTHDYTTLSLYHHDHIRIAPQGSSGPNALTIGSLPTPDGAVELGGYAFSGMYMEPRRIQDGTTLLEVGLMTPRTYEHFTTNSLANLTIPAQGRVLTLGPDTYTVRPLADGSVDVQVDRADN